MVRKVDAWECKFCRKVYSAKEDAKVCQRKGISRNLPKGTVFSNINLFYILNDNRPSIPKGSHDKNYRAVFYDSLRNISEEMHVTIKYGNREMLDNFGLTVIKSDVTRLCREDKNFAEYFAYVTKETRGEVK